MHTPPFRLKSLLFGRPLASDRLDHERLNKKTALAVLSSDAISSVAYATEQTLIVLAVLGSAALSYVVPISAVIVGLLVLVALSYRQTVFAYPAGGGSYTVAKDNLGTMPGLIAAAALLTDYILTVAVSISSGIAAITSAYPGLVPHTVAMCIVAIFILMAVNLRGVRESGIAFSVPTYLFIGMMLLMIAIGLYHRFAGDQVLTTGLAGGLAGGARVYSGTDDEHSRRLRVHLPHSPGVRGGMRRDDRHRGDLERRQRVPGAELEERGDDAGVDGDHPGRVLPRNELPRAVLWDHAERARDRALTARSPCLRHGRLYYALQYSTFAILVLAANTAFADFPRLSSILARDSYMPRQFAARGDRLGVLERDHFAEHVVAMLLVWLFHGDTSALIPLYAIGVFVCFTLSQAGMVVHWFVAKSPGWRRRAVLNGLGALATAIVSIRCRSSRSSCTARGSSC